MQMLLTRVIRKLMFLSLGTAQGPTVLYSIIPTLFIHSLMPGTSYLFFIFLENTYRSRSAKVLLALRTLRINTFLARKIKLSES